VPSATAAADKITKASGQIFAEWAIVRGCNARLLAEFLELGSCSRPRQRRWSICPHLTAIANHRRHLPTPHAHQQHKHEHNGGRAQELQIGWAATQLQRQRHKQQCKYPILLTALRPRKTGVGAKSPFCRPRARRKLSLTSAAVLGSQTSDETPLLGTISSTLQLSILSPSTVYPL
jgi:hypothetical protein